MSERIEPPNRKPRVYLAGWYTHLDPEQRQHYVDKATELADIYDLDLVLPPFPEAGVAGKEGIGLGFAVGRLAFNKIQGCHLLLADLTAFRGPHADPNTTCALGFAFGLGKPVFGFSGAKTARLRDRVFEQYGGKKDYTTEERVRIRAGEQDVKPSGEWWDGRDCALVENYGLPVASVPAAAVAASETNVQAARNWEVGLTVSFREIDRWLLREGWRA